MSHLDGLPDLFLDRSMGRIKVPQMLRAAGLRLVTLAEHYGVPADEQVADTEWLRLVGDRGWMAVMKDDRIRYVSAEREALIDGGVRAIVITSASLRADEMARRIVSSAPAAAEVCGRRSGPFLFALQANRIEEIRQRDHVEPPVILFDEAVADQFSFVFEPSAKVFEGVAAQLAGEAACCFFE